MLILISSEELFFLLKESLFPFQSLQHSLLELLVVLDYFIHPRLEYFKNRDVVLLDHRSQTATGFNEVFELSDEFVLVP